jgi:hypothetical protein
MSSEKPQSFENHARWVPLYHFGISTVLLVNFVWSLYLLVKGASWATVLGVLMAFSFLGMFYYLRAFALTVQDRLIRLEMRLRLKDLLPADLKPRIGDLSPGQLIGLRFASDEELPGLVREVLEKKLASRTEIKRRIKSWQADHLRA